jgi:hopene-associated glycosyltransferase HpnB
MDAVLLGVTGLSLAIWVGLLTARGRFWQTDQRLEPQDNPSAEAHDDGGSVQLQSASVASYPSICAVIPARNEAALLPIALRSLLTQTYPGTLTVILVDDQSTDNTAGAASDMAEALGKRSQLHILPSSPLPAGWSGKLWAMHQGVQAAQASSPDYILLTDADIEHDPNNLRRLVEKATQEQLDLASVMVRLRCESLWERLLIPAFVFFFQKLYPFRWVNDPANPMAAAAGGCILIRREVLSQIGGLQSIRHALIDDCALAQAVKWRGTKRSALSQSSFSEQSAESRSASLFHPIWLGLSDRTRSLRPYPSLDTIWTMVTRTAYTQLNYSPWLLIGTLIGMTLIYLVPPVAAMAGALTGHSAIALTGLAGWGLMTLAYFPTIRLYHYSPFLACCLPAIALLYTLMTLDSALRHWQGRGGAWKGRVYPSGG